MNTSRLLVITFKPRIARQLRKYSSFILSGLFGGAIGIFFLGGFESINPDNIDWIHEDNATAYVAQVAYVSDQWRIPIASNPNYGSELATTLTNTGPAILLGVFQKVFRIDGHLQLFGFWILLNFILQGLFAISVANNLTLSRSGKLMMVLASFTPFFLFRAEIHFWLISHFVILWSINLSIHKIKDMNYRTLWRMSIICVISYLINPYLCLMTFIINIFISILIYLNERKLRRTILQNLVPLFLVSISYILFDGFNSKIPLTESLRLLLGGAYGQFSYNLISFLNPTSGFIDSNYNDSNLVSDWSVTNLSFGNTKGSYEGYLYLGLGSLLLLLVVIMSSLKRRSDIKRASQITWIRAAIFISIPISLFSITHRLSIGRFEYSIVGEGLDYLFSWGFSLFRSSGRFMWILGYVIIICSIYFVDKFIKSRILIFSLVIVLQVTDLGFPLFEKYQKSKKEHAIKTDVFDYSDFSDIELSKMGISKVLLYPAGNGTRGFERIALWAFDQSIVSNAFESAKINHLRISNLNRALYDEICSGNPKVNVAYVIPIEYLDNFKSCNIDLTQSEMILDFIVILTRT